MKENNFDLLRVLLSLVVVMAHVGALTRNSQLTPLTSYFDSGFAVDAFFVVSGYLITMSYENSRSIRSYFEKRGRRIYPAYFTVVILCSVLLLIVSNRSMSDYFNIEWFQYLLSNLTFLNFMQPSLPGVFEGQTLEAVNGALWTIKIEVMFYLVLPLLIILINRFGRLRIILLVYTGSVAYSMALGYLALHGENHIYSLLEHQLPGQLCFFMAGTLLFYYSDNLHKFGLLLPMLGVTCFFLGRFFPVMYPIYPMAIGVMVIYLATNSKYLGNWGKYGDFSYGIYIWHFPLIQTFISIGFFTYSPWLALFALLPCVILLAFLSWHLIEKPFLRTKSHYRQVESH